MRVCMVAYAYYFTDARIKGYVNSLIKRGINVDVLSLKEPGKTIKKEGNGNLTIYYLSNKYVGKNQVKYVMSYMKFFLIAFIQLFALYVKNKYQIIHIHNMPNFIVFTAIFPKFFGSKLILDMHDIMSKNFIEKFGNKWLFDFLLRIEESLSSNFANNIICADHTQKDYLVKKRKIPTEKITVIMNLPDIKIFKYKDRISKNKHLNIVYHGTITHRLGIDILIESVAIASKKIPVKFFIYGTGDYLDNAMEIVEDMGLKEDISFSKKFFRVEEIPDILQNKHLAIIGNRKNEATKYMVPVKMMEYMASGIPVIVPKLSNITRYFSDEQVCFYEPENVESLSNKIIYLINTLKKEEI